MNRESLGTALLFLTTFALYLWCLAPSIALIDSSEFVTAAHCLGNAHSPGYPTYVIVGKLFSLLPLNCIAYRVNLLSAVAAALGIALLFKLAGLWFDTRAALAGALILACSGTYWAVAETAEVYAVALLVFVMILYTLERNRARDPVDLRPLMVVALLYGLSTGLHQMLIFVAPAVVYLVWLRYRFKPLALKTLSVLVVFGLSGYSIQGAMPLRAHAGAWYSWELPRTFSRFYNLITTATYHGQRFIRSWQAFDDSVRNYAEVIVADFTLASVVLAVFGVAVLLRQNNRKGLFLILLWFTSTAAAVVLFNIPREWMFFLNVFYLPGSIAIALSAGVALGKLARVHKTLMIIIIPVLGMQIHQHYKTNNKSEYYLVYDWALNVMTAAAPDAIVITQQDEPFALAYIQLVERYRPDVTALYYKTFANPTAWYLEYLTKLNPGLRVPVLTGGGKLSGVEALAEGLRGLLTFNARPVHLTTYAAELAGSLLTVPRGLLYSISLKSGQTNSQPFRNLWPLLRSRGLIPQLPYYEHADLELLNGYALNLRLTLLRGGAQMTAAEKKGLEELLNQWYGSGL